LLLFRKIHTFRHEAAFSTWLHRLAVNLVLMRLRKKPPTVSIEASPDPDEETGWLSIDVGIPDPLLAGSLDRVNLDRCTSGCRLGTGQYLSRTISKDTNTTRLMTCWDAR
jgi:DNA-directed RNA polymerase specialized sigma24 family protein